MAGYKIPVLHHLINIDFVDENLTGTNKIFYLLSNLGIQSGTGSWERFFAVESRASSFTQSQDDQPSTGSEGCKHVGRDGICRPEGSRATISDVQQNFLHLSTDKSLREVMLIRPLKPFPDVAADIPTISHQGKSCQEEVEASLYQLCLFLFSVFHISRAFHFQHHLSVVYSIVLKV